MRRRLLIPTALACAILAGSVAAQTAYRCDNNGQTVYSDKPCPAGKAVVGTQDSAEQKAASKDANAQMRQDNADLNKRLSDRQKLEAQERAAARKAAGKPVTAAKGGGRIAKAKAAKKPRAAKPARSKKKSKPDATVSIIQ